MQLSSLLLFLPWLAFVSAAPSCGLIPPTQTASSSIAVPATVNASSDDFVAAAWYAAWDTAPPSSISWSKYNVVKFAFATVTNDTSTLSFNATLLQEFVSQAQENDVKALVSVGGWNGGIFFSDIMATADNRTAFVNTCAEFIQTYSLDGLDFDWEYPAQLAECNIYSPNDTANFALFLQELRAKVGSNSMITLATSLKPYLGADGATPITNATVFADAVDHIAIMVYDVFGSFSATVGPNAPLADSCAAPANQQGSATSAVQAWTSAGFPSNKIVLGVPSYGHSFSVDSANALSSDNEITLYASFNKADQPWGPSDTSSSIAIVDPCGQPSGVSGIFTFSQLISTGFLDNTGSLLQSSTGISYRYDNCSQTPFLYNETSSVMISFDDATSFAAKGQFIADNNLLGFSMWEATGDYNDILLDSISNAMGLEQDCS